MKVTYTKLELKIALASISNQQLDSISAKELEVKKFVGDDYLCPANDGAKKMALTAKHHGITVSELINSPNLEVLQSQYLSACTERMVKALEEVAGLTRKQAKAFLAKSAGLLDD